jgi:hypothetical protein
MFRRRANYLKSSLRIMTSQYSMIWLTIILSMISGCASVKDIFKPTAIGPKFQYEKQDNSQYVTIYLYRPWRYGGSIPAPLITINGEEILFLRNGGYTKIQTTIGQYILETHHSDSWVYGMEDHLVLNAKQNQTYFIRVLPANGFGRSNYELSIFDEQDAFKEISDTGYLDPKKQQYQYDENYNIACKIGNHPAECKNETKNLKDRSGPGRFILEFVIYTGIMLAILL